MRPGLSIIFPQGIRISKNIGHLTSRSVAKRPLNGTSKVNRQTDTQKDKQTQIGTFRLIESIGPKGRCFENQKSQVNLIVTYVIIHFFIKITWEIVCSKCQYADTNNTPEDEFVSHINRLANLAVKTCRLFFFSLFLMRTWLLIFAGPFSRVCFHGAIEIFLGTKERFRDIRTRFLGIKERFCVPGKRWRKKLY